MQTIQNELILLAEDYNTLFSYLQGRNTRTAFDRKNAEELQSELKKATLVAKDQFPTDVVRINSTVKIRDEERNRVMEFMLVVPELANIKDKRISVMAPIGTALIGFRKGQLVEWEMPSGRKSFTILDVINE